MMKLSVPLQDCSGRGTHEQGGLGLAVGSIEFTRLKPTKPVLDSGLPLGSLLPLPLGLGRAPDAHLGRGHLRMITALAARALRTARGVTPARRGPSARRAAVATTATRCRDHHNLPRFPVKSVFQVPYPINATTAVGYGLGAVPPFVAFAVAKSTAMNRCRFAKSGC
jgi:hypothetical protein